ncbi:MAG TPA: hypothetical protein VNC22_03185 [Sporichthya sp.]|nr:hypothetical protein [Sporichthya sp.]
MTQPKINTISRGGSRFYVSPLNGDKVPGVTSVVGMLPKGFLGPWNAKLVAETAVDSLGEVVSIAMKDRQAAIDFLKGAPRRFTSKAADVGTDAHDVFEKMARGETPGRMHPELKVYADHFSAFLDEFQPEFLHLEQTVWSETHGYAGSFDAIMKVDGEIVGADWKTTRSGVHAEVAIQLAAYRFADYILDPETSDQIDIPKWTGGAVFHVRPEGWSLVPVRCDEAVFEYFLHLRRVFEWDREVKDTVLGQPLNVGAKKRAAPRRRSA